MTFNFLLSFNVQLLLFPSPLCYDWSSDAIPLVQNIYDVRNLQTLTFYTCLFLIVKQIYGILNLRDLISDLQSMSGSENKKCKTWKSTYGDLLMGKRIRICWRVFHEKMVNFTMQSLIRSKQLNNLNHIGFKSNVEDVIQDKVELTEEKIKDILEGEKTQYNVSEYSNHGDDTLSVCDNVESISQSSGYGSEASVDDNNDDIIVENKPKHTNLYSGKCNHRKQSKPPKAKV